MLAPKPRVGICWGPTFVGKREDPPKEGVLLSFLFSHPWKRGVLSQRPRVLEAVPGQPPSLPTTWGLLSRQEVLGSGNQEDIPHQEAGRGAEGMGPGCPEQESPL